jgi:cell division protein FtsQ
MRKKLLKWTLLIVLLAYTAVMTVWATGVANSTPCTGVEVLVDGDSKLVAPTRQGVLAEIDKYPSFIGKPIGSINVKSIESHLGKMNNFEEVQCAMLSSGKLCIRVLPLVPELRIFTSNGNSYYINKEGKRIDAKADFFTDVPIAAGNFSQKLKPSDLLPIVRYINANSTLKSLITMIYVKSPTNIIMVPCIRGHVINFGDTSRIKDKFDNLLTMYRQVMPYKGWNTYDTISVKFKGQVVASRRNKALPDHGAVTDDGEDVEESALAETVLEN